MTLEDSKILIEDSKNLLKEIELLYARDISNGEDSPLLRVRIKQFLENINSALDYAAFAVFTEYCAPRIKEEEPEKLTSRESRVYFPCLGEPDKFDNYINDRFKYLTEEKIEIVRIFNKYQPFPARTKWLSYLKELVNSNKHRTLLKQAQQHTTAINRLTASNGASISNLTIISENGSFPFEFINKDGSESTITTFDGEYKIEFIFPNINQPALATLRRIIRSAPSVIKELEEIL